MARGASVVNNVANEGALAQALDCVGNAPRDQQVVHTLRGIVDQTQDPRGPSYTSVGDMDVHERTMSVNSRVSNNGLLPYYVPASYDLANMTEHEQLTQATKDSQPQPPPPAGLSEQQELQIILEESRRSSSEELRVEMPAFNNTTLVRVNTAPADAGTGGNGEDKTPVLIASSLQLYC